MANGSLGAEPSERDQADPLPPPNLYSTSKPEEGGASGELWAVVRALSFLVGVVLVLGWLLS